MKRIYFGFVLFISANLNAQNEFYISGDNNASTFEVYVVGNDGVNPTLFVQGEIVNNEGVFVNSDGVIELTGNFTNTANGTSAFYESNGEERFSGSGNSNISGNLSGTTLNRNQLNNLKVDKDAATNYINLLSNVHLNENGTVDFVGNGIIRTDNTSHGNDGAAYSNYLFVRNNSSSAITNASLTAGTSNKYIEGKLRRNTNGTAAYAFPVGGSTNGVEPLASFTYKCQ